MLSGKALNVALAIWYLRGLKKDAKILHLVPSAVKPFVAGRHSVYRGLQQLENAGLIKLERHRGRSPKIQLLKLDTNFGEKP
jgi:hypothetical protein